MAENLHTKEDLRQRQALPLEAKISMTQLRIRQWHNYWCGDVCVSFSGGKDSTVLLHLVRQMYPDVKAIFVNTGLEYPEIQQFVRTFDNVDIVRPEMRFDEVISKYGYPLISKEVAEAIYYARRIRSQTVQVEREREREAKKRLTRPLANGRDLSPSNAQRVVAYKREELCGNRAKPSATKFGGGTQTLAYPKNPAWYNYEYGKRDRLKLNGFRTGVNGTTTTEGRSTQTLQTKMTCEPSEISSGTQTTTIGEGGIFSNAEEQFGISSQFNKERYLPIARDLPVPISHYCCNVMKKKPVKAAQKRLGLAPILGTMAEESRIRMQGWLRTGCNAFDSKQPKSQPLSFWTEQDVLRYAVENNIEFASVYGDVVAVDEFGSEYDPKSLLIPNCKLKCTGCERTGCVFCAFGFHNERGETRFQRLARTHPRQYEYCMGGGQWVDNPAYDPTAPKMDGTWQNWNPKKIWVPSKQGLGMKKVFDMVNEIYGKDFYRYE